MTSREKVEILKKYFGDKNGDIDLSGLDLTGAKVNLSMIKASKIDNSNQTAHVIKNDNQFASLNIDNENQKSKHIDNMSQFAVKSINNSNQKSKGNIRNKEQNAKDEIYND